MSKQSNQLGQEDELGIMAFQRLIASWKDRYKPESVLFEPESEKLIRDSSVLVPPELIVVNLSKLLLCAAS